MLKSMLNIVLGRTNNAGPLTGAISFDLVIKYVDSTNDDLTKSFATAAEREQEFNRLTANRATSRKIAQINYDNTLVFWRRLNVQDELPDEVPELPGEGELVLRITGGDGEIVLDTIGYPLDRIKNSLLSQVNLLRFGAVQEMSVLRRVVACERISILRKPGNIMIPESAASLNSDHDDEE